MRLEMNQDDVCLKPKQLLKMRGGAGYTVLCQSGSVWLTQARDQRDIVLGAGESFALDRNGPALLQAFEQSAISIAPPASRIRSAARAASPGNAAVGAVLPNGAMGA